MAKKGIDVSYANRSIDWSEVKKSGIEFAILRSTFGSESESQIDSQYFQNAQGCVKNNIPFATYHFAYFVNEQTAKAEADFAIKKANEYKNYIKFIVLDIEEDSVRYAKNMGYNPDWTACSIAFMEKVRAAGYIPVLYSNYNWLKNIFNYNKLKNYKLWYAAPDATKPAYTCAIWQYSWQGKVNGINGDVDMDYLYDETLFSKSTSTASKTTTETAVSSTQDDRQKFINQAKTYIGKDGNYVCNTKLGLGAVYDWCAFSISAIMKDCGFIGKYQGDIYGYASDAAREDNGKFGEWFKKGEKTVQPGDYIMFRYSSFLNPIDQYSASHVGIVESVDGDKVTTLEGNVDGYGADWAGTSSFKRKTRYLSNSDVYAFYRPYWKKSTTTGTSNKPVTSNKNDTKITEISAAKDVNFSVKVISDNGVNIRAGASTAKKILGAVPCGAVIKVTKQTIGGGYTWGLITYEGTTGWVALDYTTKVENTVSFKNGDKVRVKAGAVVYGTDQELSSFVCKTIYQIIEVSGNRIVIGVNGQVTAAVDKKYLIKV